MRRPPARSLVVILILALAAAYTVQRQIRTPVFSGTASTPAGSATRYVFHTDLAGWYAPTADESVVASTMDLRANALALTLPANLGDWRGRDLDASTEIEALYAQPDVVVRREYADRTGRVVWLTVIFSRGPKSFRLFEHTPAICYESAGWVRELERVEHVSLNQGSIALRLEGFARGGERHAVLSWYQWGSPDRDPAMGVAAWRLAAEAPDGLDQATMRSSGLVSLLFSEALPWHRF